MVPMGKQRRRWVPLQTEVLAAARASETRHREEAMVCVKSYPMTHRKALEAPTPGSTRVLELNPECFCAQVWTRDGWYTLRKMLTQEGAEGVLQDRRGPGDPRERA